MSFGHASEHFLHIGNRISISIIHEFGLLMSDLRHGKCLSFVEVHPVILNAHNRIDFRELKGNDRLSGSFCSALPEPTCLLSLQREADHISSFFIRLELQRLRTS